jgi:hypothetical protein
MRNKSSGNATISVASYQNDPLYPRIVCAVAVLLDKGKVVAPADVLAGMGLLAPEHVDGWRRGRIPYLEQAIDCNLTLQLHFITHSEPCA